MDEQKAGADIKEMKDKSCECCAVNQPFFFVNGRELTGLGIFCAGHVRRPTRMLPVFCVCASLYVWGFSNWDCPVRGSQVADVYQNRFLENWQEISRIRKPIIAAVSGYAVSSLQKNIPTPLHPLRPIIPLVALPSVRLIG